MLTHFPQGYKRNWLACRRTSFDFYNPLKIKSMKKKLTIGSSRSHAVKKALLIMKLSFLLILAGALQVSAKVNGQSEITLKLNQVEISRVLSTIEKQGTYRFLYNSRLKDIHDKISIDVDRTEIQDVLKRVFTGTDLT